VETLDIAILPLTDRINVERFELGLRAKRGARHTLRVQAGRHIGQVSVLEIRKDGLILFYRGEKVKLPL